MKMAIMTTESTAETRNTVWGPAVVAINPVIAAPVTTDMASLTDSARMAVGNKSARWRCSRREFQRIRHTRPCGANDKPAKKNGRNIPRLSIPVGTDSMGANGSSHMTMPCSSASTTMPHCRQGTLTKKVMRTPHSALPRHTAAELKAAAQGEAVWVATHVITPSGASTCGRRSANVIQVRPRPPSPLSTWTSLISSGADLEVMGEGAGTEELTASAYAFVSRPVMTRRCDPLGVLVTTS